MGCPPPLAMLAFPTSRNRHVIPCPTLSREAWEPSLRLEYTVNDARVSKTVQNVSVVRFLFATTPRTCITCPTRCICTHQRSIRFRDARARGEIFVRSERSPPRASCKNQLILDARSRSDSRIPSSVKSVGPSQKMESATCLFDVWDVSLLFVLGKIEP